MVTRPALDEVLSDTIMVALAERLLRLAENYAALQEQPQSQHRDEALAATRAEIRHSELARLRVIEAVEGESEERFREQLHAVYGDTTGYWHEFLDR